MNNNADWKKGDLALCVKVGPWVWDTDNLPNGEQRVRAGMVLRVRAIQSKSCGALILWFEGVGGHGYNDSFLASRFRKVTPPKADEFDREVIDLMNGKPAPVEYTVGG